VRHHLLRAIALCALALAPTVAFAQGDEIQVYDGNLAPVGVFNLTWHNNFTPNGIKTPAFPGAITSNKSWNGVTEWAYGITDWFEGGLYLPLYSRDENLGWKIDGFKLRTLFAVPHANDRTFFYGSNFEFSFNAKWWDTKRFTSEIRPIIGWHLDKFDLILNPIVDTQYDGFRNLEFVPSERVAYNPSSKWALALEEYADYGKVNNFAPVSNQAHQLFAVFDYAGALDIEAGVGFGLTDSSDKFQLKLIVARDLNRRPKP
jgi:hypothetical protein